MSKQDRVYTRTPSDLDRKYGIGAIQKMVKEHEEKLSQLIQTMEQHKETSSKKIEDLEKKIADLEETAADLEKTVADLEETVADLTTNDEEGTT